MSKKKVEKKSVEVSIKYNTSDTIITRFVTNITIQVLNDVFKISFYEAKPELWFDSGKKPSNKYEADCVGAVVMSADKVRDFIDILQSQLNKYDSQLEK